MLYTVFVATVYMYHIYLTIAICYSLKAILIRIWLDSVAYYTAKHRTANAEGIYWAVFCLYVVLAIIYIGNPCHKHYGVCYAFTLFQCQ